MSREAGLALCKIKKSNVKSTYLSGLFARLKLLDVCISNYHIFVILISHRSKIDYLKSSRAFKI